MSYNAFHHDTHNLHGLVVTFNSITGSHDRWACDTFRSTSPIIYSVENKKLKKKILWKSEREGGGWGGGRVKCWNVNYIPERHHLDRENTHHIGEPAHWIRLATGSICTSWNQSPSLIWLGQPRRRKRKLLCSLIMLVLLCTPPHPLACLLCIPMSSVPTGRVMTVVKVNATEICLYLTLSVCVAARLIYTFFTPLPHYCFEHFFLS